MSYQTEYYRKNKEKVLAYQREYRKKNRDALSKRDRNKRERRWQEAINLLGGRCQRCDGVFPSCVYDLHHIDPTQKEFTIGENMLVGEEKFKTEVMKCLLLCANCHRLEHRKDSD